jgi:hypothetical protein
MCRRDFKMAWRILIALLLSFPASARWKPEYAQLPQATQDWYQAQELTTAAQKRFAFKSCCDHSDVVHTKFRAGASDEWYWLDATNQWQRVPDDIIHWDTPTPDGQAVMFAVGNEPVCFYPPQSGN